MGKHQAVPLTGSDQLIVSGSGWVSFVSVSETSGSALAHFILYDGKDSTGNKIADVYMPEGTNIFSGLGEKRLGFRNSLFLHAAAGVFVGSISVRMSATPQEWYAEYERYEATQPQG